MVKKAIVADDRQNWRENYVYAIKKGNFPDLEIDEVESGSDLVARVLQGDYSLVISDNDMEQEDAGLKALRAIRAAGNNTPFYLCSAGSIEQVALDAGANGFYNKASFDADKVLEDVAQYLR